jgi:hypothetical protein
MAVARHSTELIGTGAFIAQLRSHALRALGRMYRRDERMFVFRHRRTAAGVAAEGLSARYSAISVIGLSEDPSVHVPSVLDGHDLHHVCGRLLTDVTTNTNVGTVALILWAARAAEYPDRKWARERLVELRPAERTLPTVELAWSLAALCIDTDADLDGLRERLARRLIAALEPSAIFPHAVLDSGARSRGLRSHVACFADLVYPVHALALFSQLTGDRPARDAAIRCADHFCRLQGSAGQWWWHYDRRSGRVVERYPVYAVHQDAMAPMALFALEDATGLDYGRAIARGLAWLQRAPELGGGSLVDVSADLIWRKVARREPAKLSRYAQAMASRMHRRVRVPGLDLVFPPSAVDHEDRPYHLGWMLHAWSPARVARCLRAEDGA